MQHRDKQVDKRTEGCIWVNTDIMSTREYYWRETVDGGALS